MLILQRVFYAVEDMVRTAIPHQKDKWKAASQLLVSELNAAIDLSRGINLRKIEIVNGEIELFPEGVSVLDEMVDTGSAWLKLYPDVAKEFQTALNVAVSKDVSLYRQALDSLRFGLEKLLKIILNNNASLEKQREPLLRWLKDKGVHVHIRNNYVTLLNQFTDYQNVDVKHDHDPDPNELKVWSDTELEYMIYLTATLMRLVLRTATGK